MAVSSQLYLRPLDLILPYDYALHAEEYTFLSKARVFQENLALPIQFDGIIPISSEAAWLLQEMLELLIYSFGTIYKLNSAMNPQTITDIFLNKLVIDELHETSP